MLLTPQRTDKDRKEDTILVTELIRGMPARSPHLTISPATDTVICSAPYLVSGVGLSTAPFVTRQDLGYGVPHGYYPVAITTKRSEIVRAVPISVLTFSDERHSRTTKQVRTVVISKPPQAHRD